MNETVLVNPPRRIVWVMLAALTGALAILLVGILPAEFNRDPTGLGRASGIAELWAPAEEVLSASSVSTPALHPAKVPLRSDVIEIPLGVGTANSTGEEEVEYKVHLEVGASYVYSWEVPGVANPEEFYSEFHGHTLEAGKAMTVAYYRKATGHLRQRHPHRAICRGPWLVFPEPVGEASRGSSAAFGVLDRFAINLQHTRLP